MTRLAEKGRSDVFVGEETVSAGAASNQVVPWGEVCVVDCHLTCWRRAWKK